MFLREGFLTVSVADDLVSGKQILAGDQWRLNTPISGGGRPAYRLVLGSNPVDLLGRGDAGEDLLSAQDAAPSCQFAQQWELRMMAR